MLTLRSIAALAPDTTIWDEGKSAVPGFGARRRTGVAASYFLKYRTAEGRQRFHTIGRHGAPWTPDAARAEARRLLGEVTKGVDPAGQKQDARNAKTVADLCDAYLEAAKAGRILTRRKAAKKASTLATDTGRIERHIKPLLGRLKVATVTRQDVERFRDAVSEGETKARIKTGKHGLARVTGGRGTSTRTMGLLGAIFSFAVRRGLRSDNPVHGIERHADGQRDRRLSDAEYAALGEALGSMQATAWPVAVAAANFLALTGWRRGEMLALKWSEVDLATRTARLADTKTGASLRPLSHAACDVLRDLPRIGSLVFPASAGTDKLMRGFHKVWLRIAAKASLPTDVTPHVLRHSLASIAADMGYSELTIAALLGHRKASVTSKYAHHADAVLLAAADAVANRVSELMGDRKAPGVVVTLRQAGGQRKSTNAGIGRPADKRASPVVSPSSQGNSRGLAMTEVSDVESRSEEDLAYLADLLRKANPRRRLRGEKGAALRELDEIEQRLQAGNTTTDERLDLDARLWGLNDVLGPGRFSWRGKQRPKGAPSKNVDQNLDEELLQRAEELTPEMDSFGAALRYVVDEAIRDKRFGSTVEQESHVQRLRRKARRHGSRFCALEPPAPQQSVAQQRFATIHKTIAKMRAVRHQG